MRKPKIYADFQKLDDFGRLILSCKQTYNDIGRQQLNLRRELEVVFYSDDIDDEGNEDELRVNGIIDYDECSNSWVGIYDPDKFYHASEE